MLKLAVDLLWVRPEKVGGIESYIRNLLDGLMTLSDEFELWLMVSVDNADTFKKYEQDHRFHLHVCNIKSANVGKRIIWQNIHLGAEIRSLNLDCCFEPYYAKPFLGVKDIKFITTIHDLQALHYPQYFSKFKVAWMKASWKNDVKTSVKIIAISNYVKEDIISNFDADPNKIIAIYNPILIKRDDIEDFAIVHKKYGINENEYYFTVSSLLPHKNLETLIKVFKKIKEDDINLPCKLIISGVGGKSKEKLINMIESAGLKENIVLTPFISNTERNTLYKYCKVFLFPSLFEGFGMPPIEALLMGTGVITTRESCLPEVTQNKCSYVNNPYSVDEWIGAMEKGANKPADFDFDRYSLHNITRKYFDTFLNFEKK